MHWRAIAFAGLCGLPTAAQSEPDPVVRYLMATPVSRFEHGLLVLNKHLSQIERIQYFDGFVSAYYSWDTNQLIVSALVRSDDVNDAQCTFWLDKVKAVLGVDPTSGKYHNNVISQVTQSFRDRGFLADDPVEVITGGLDKITDVDVMVTDAFVGSERTRQIGCHSELLKTEILFKR